MRENLFEECGSSLQFRGTKAVAEARVEQHRLILMLVFSFFYLSSICSPFLCLSFLFLNTIFYFICMHLQKWTNKTIVKRLLCT